jgi:hypothetical protein
MDLVREILIATERGETYFKGGNEKEVEAHIKMLENGGLIYGCGRNLWGMTWAGYNLLDAMRDESLWKKAKGVLMQEGMSWTLEILKAWVTDQLKRQLKIRDLKVTFHSRPSFVLAVPNPPVPLILSN